MAKTEVTRSLSPEYCGNCEPTRKRMGLPPIKMIVLPEVTNLMNLVVRVCPSCDGDVPNAKRQIS